LCFGLGPHYCTGAPARRLMIRVRCAWLLEGITHLQGNKNVHCADATV
jgi:cytochrome P450